MIPGDWEVKSVNGVCLKVKPNQYPSFGNPDHPLHSLLKLSS